MTFFLDIVLMFLDFTNLQHMSDFEAFIDLGLLLTIKTSPITDSCCCKRNKREK